MNNIKQIPGTNHLIVATDLGVYILYGGTTTWVNNSFGLPNVIVTDIDFNVPLNKVYISTFGRGIWESGLSLINGLTDAKSNLTSFNLYPTINKGNFTISFEDNLEERTLEIIDVMGQIVYTQNFIDTKVSVNLNLASGAYYAKVSSKSKMGVKKFIVE